MCFGVAMDISHVWVARGRYKHQLNSRHALRKLHSVVHIAVLVDVAMHPLYKYKYSYKYKYKYS